MLRNVFLVHMSHVQRWELFGCGLKLRICDGPSWVPDLAAPWPQRIDPWTQFSSGCSRICATYAGAGVLNIAGVQCATVSGATAAVSGTGPDQVQLVRSWEPSDMETAIYVTGDSVSDAFARTLLQDWTKDRFPQFSLTPLEDWKASGGNGLFGPAARPATWVSCEPFDRTDYTGNLAYCCCLGRSFITTAEGYIGLGPDGVEPGLSPFLLFYASYVALRLADVQFPRRHNMCVSRMFPPSRASPDAERPVPACRRCLCLRTPRCTGSTWASSNPVARTYSL